MNRRFIHSSLLLILVLSTLYLPLFTTPVNSAVTMRKVKVTLTHIDIYNTHDQSCNNIRYSFDISWKRIYGNYWDAYSSDSDYSLSDADGYRTSEHQYISEYSDNTKNDIDVDPDVSSSSVYAANYVKNQFKI